jgi:hypothetical protein
VPQVSSAKESGDVKALKKAQRKVSLFTEQLQESNPILTDISDAMTLEGELLEKADAAKTDADRKAFLAQAEECKQKKERGNVLLQECSAKYGNAMKKLREEA